jgi:tripartite-type tricarboxylate transporter receptor subunit TctC
MDILDVPMKVASDLGRRGRHHRRTASTVWIGGVLATFGVLVATLILGLGDAHAQAWPTKPIKFIVGYPAGGGADTVARIFSERMAKSLGQPIVVENRPGASGQIATQSVVRAEPDGYTLLVSTISDISIAPATFKTLPFDLEKDLKSITMLAKWAQVLVAAPNFPPNTLSEMIAYVKANPGKVSYSSFGVNTLNHVNGERFKLATGIDALHIPYKGSGPSLTDLMGGQVQYTFDAPATTINLVKTGKIKGIAVAGNERLANADNIPTMAEAGLKDFVIYSWIGLFAPAHTPKAIIDRLNAAANAEMSSQEFIAAMQGRGIQPGGGTPDEFDRTIRSEIAYWRQIAPQIGITPQ